MEVGIDSFASVGTSENGETADATQSVAELLERIEQADRSGLDVFGIGEHHRHEFLDSANAVILAAAAARTERIRLTSAVTVLSAADPVRVFQQFATLDLISKGRAEMVVGRGSFTEAFPLFGFSLGDYDEIFAEKLELLLKIRDNETVDWSGKFRPALENQAIYPRPLQKPFPIWIGVGGTPQSFRRAGMLGLPLVVAIIGGETHRFRSLVDLYRDAGEYAGHAPETLKVSLHSIGYVADTTEQAVFKVGDEVYYSPQIFGEFGSYAQYHVADAAIVALKPANLSHIEAASFPLAGGTAWDCLVTRGNLQVGETVLIHAGAGGVGSIAVQLAKAIGAYVFATCSSRNRDFVTELGADRVIDYKNEDYVEVIRRETKGLGVDLVLDTIGGETIQRSLEIIRPFGRLTSIVDIAIPQSLLKAWGKNLTIHFVLSPQYRAKLEALTKLIERHQLRPVIDSVFSWDQVVLAHQRLEQGGTRGKIVLKFTEN